MAKTKSLSHSFQKLVTFKDLQKVIESQPGQDYNQLQRLKDSETNHSAAVNDEIVYIVIILLY